MTNGAGSIITITATPIATAPCDLTSTFSAPTSSPSAPAGALCISCDKVYNDAVAVCAGARDFCLTEQQPQFVITQQPCNDFYNFCTQEATAQKATCAATPTACASCDAYYTSLAATCYQANTNITDYEKGYQSGLSIPTVVLGLQRATASLALTRCDALTQQSHTAAGCSPSPSCQTPCYDNLLFGQQAWNLWGYCNTLPQYPGSSEISCANIKATITTLALTPQGNCNAFAAANGYAPTICAAVGDWMKTVTVLYTDAMMC
ncbi:hypothetical protein RQP46_006849 [Phenoliferia psychrophenolica]